MTLSNPSIGKPGIAAHRGGSLLWPENTLFAFHKAIELGVHALEFDVHLSRDGRAVVLHDPTLDRTTQGNGPVSQLDWSVLSKIRMKAKPEERIPLFEEVLDLVNPLPVAPIVELKLDHAGTRHRGIEAVVLDALSTRGLLERSYIISFSFEILETVRRLDKTVPIMGNLSEKNIDTLGGIDGAICKLQDLDAKGINIKHLHVTAELMAKLDDARMELSVWTVNETDLMEKFTDLGATLLVTDRPDLALGVVRDRNRL